MVVAKLIGHSSPSPSASCQYNSSLHFARVTCVTNSWRIASLSSSVFSIAINEEVQAQLQILNEIDDFSVASEFNFCYSLLVWFISADLRIDRVETLSRDIQYSGGSRRVRQLDCVKFEDTEREGPLQVRAMAEFDNNTCARLEFLESIDLNRLLFVQSEWKPTRSEPTSFSLAISDGLDAWRFEGTEAFVKDRAEAWDKSVSWVMEKIKFYLSVGQVGVTYRFTKTRDNQRKLSFDIEDKESDLSLTANFSLVNAPDPGSVTSGLLDFLHDSNCRLTESYLRKRRDFDRMTRENEALTEQNERFKALKNQFKEDAFKKFVPVLNSKKAKLRELRKEIKKLTEQTKSKIKEDSERDNTTSSSSEDDEEESDHQRSSAEEKIERGEAFSESLVGEVKAISEPVATFVVDAEPDPDATQPLLDEIEPAGPSSQLPKEAGSSCLSAMVGDTPYVGLQRKKRRN